MAIKSYFFYTCRILNLNRLACFNKFPQNHWLKIIFFVSCSISERPMINITNWVITLNYSRDIPLVNTNHDCIISTLQQIWNKKAECGSDNCTNQHSDAQISLLLLLLLLHCCCYLYMKHFITFISGCYSLMLLHW